MMRSVAGSSVAAFVAAVTIGVATAHADTYTANTTVDDVDATPGNGICATSTGVCTLRAAVQEANAHAGADVIALPAGLFLLSVTGAGEDLAATGDLDVTESLEINGAGRESTIVDGLNADRILQSAAPTFTLRDLTLRHGSASSAPGGALYQNIATVVIERVRFESNLSMVGGAVAQVGGALTISDSVFDANLASSSGDGGAVILGGTGNLTLANTEFTNNVSLGGDGGAVNSLSTGSLMVTNCTFSSNTADNGGGLFATMTSSSSIDGCTFEGNQALNAGAGFIAASTGNVTVSNTKALGNIARVIGGGYAASGAAIQVSGGEFSDNVTFDGTGGGLFVSATTDATVQDTILRRNAGGTGPGGGLFVTSGGGSIVVTNVEASENSAGVGGGIFLSGSTLTLSRLRVLNNGSGAGPGGGLFFSGTTVSLSDSTIDGNVAASPGGGIYGTATGLAISSSTVSNNRAAGAATGLGGGAFLAAGSASTVTNATFSGNVAEAMGGGAYTAGDFTLRNVTVADNTSPMGSGLFNGGGTLTLTSAIVAGSAASHCAGTAVTSGGFNIDSTGTCGLLGGTDRTVDPQLGALADNGGPTLTHLPTASSPAIDGGNPTGCPAADQRGQSRPTDGNGDGTAICDAGAVEFLDLCPADPSKTLPGVCGCGDADTDAALANGAADCLINGELKARLARAKDIVNALTGNPSEDALETELKTIADGLGAYVKQFSAQIGLTNPKAKLSKLAKKVKKAAKKVTKASSAKIGKAKPKAIAAIDAMDQAVAPQP